MAGEASGQSTGGGFLGEPKGWRPLANPIPRFLAKVQVQENGCWEWTAAKYWHGYGAFSVGHDLHGYAHRWAYLFFVGKIPEGHYVDHLCGNRACVNPDHLEAVSPSVNSLRGRNPEVTRARYRAQTRCKRGHPFDEENTYRHPTGRRVCLTCRRKYDAAWKRADRAGAPVRSPLAGQRPARAASTKQPKDRLAEVKQRFLSKVEMTTSGCWEWTAGCFPTGYGKFRVGRAGTSYAHRWSYIFFVGLIPEELEIDHLCRNRKCVNPEHLEAVSHSENSLRAGAGQATGARNRAKTHCAKGHPFDEENTYRNPQGERACRTCQRLHARAYYWRKKSMGDQQL